MNGQKVTDTTAMRRVCPTNSRADRIGQDLQGSRVAPANVGIPWLGRFRTGSIAGIPPMQKSSGFSIGNLAESEWRSSAGFRGVAADGSSALDLYRLSGGSRRPPRRLPEVKT
jgi:hypothetical protein